MIRYFDILVQRQAVAETLQYTVLARATLSVPALHNNINNIS
jgi:hypothetical protein